MKRPWLAALPVLTLSLLGTTHRIGWAAPSSDTSAAETAPAATPPAPDVSTTPAAAADSAPAATAPGDKPASSTAPAATPGQAADTAVELAPVPADQAVNPFFVEGDRLTWARQLSREELDRRIADVSRRIERLRGDLDRARKGGSRRESSDRQRDLERQLADSSRELADLYAQMARRNAAGRFYTVVPGQRNNLSQPGYASQPVPALSDLPIVGNLFGGGSLGEIGQHKVSLHREKADALQSMLDLLKEANASYVINGDVAGGRSVTFHFDNVPLEDALGAVAEAAGLRYHVRGNVIVLTPTGAGTVYFGNSLSSTPRIDAPYFPVPRTPSSILTAPAQPGAPLALPGVGAPGVMETWRTPNGMVTVRPAPLPQAFLRETVRLEHLTVRDLFDKLDLPTENDDDVLRWDRSIGRGKDVTSGLEALEGDPDGQALTLEGTDSAIRRFRDRVRRLDR